MQVAESTSLQQGRCVVASNRPTTAPPALMTPNSIMFPLDISSPPSLPSRRYGNPFHDIQDHHDIDNESQHLLLPTFSPDTMSCSDIYEERFSRDYQDIEEESLTDYDTTFLSLSSSLSFEHDRLPRPQLKPRALSFEHDRLCPRPTLKPRISSMYRNVEETSLFLDTPMVSTPLPAGILYPFALDDRSLSPPTLLDDVAECDGYTSEDEDSIPWLRYRFSNIHQSEP